MLTIAACNQVQGQQQLSPDEFQKKLTEATSSKQAILVDVRTPAEFAQGNIEGAVNMDFRNERFDSMIAALDKQKTIFVYCASGGRSESAAEQLRQKGFSKVVDLKGGIIAWEGAGKPLANAKPKNREYSVAEFDEAIKGEKLVLVDFYTTWCGPCKLMAPDIERIKQEMADKVIVIKVDCEAYPDLAARYQVSGYPTVNFYRNGQVVRSMLGRQSYEELAMAVRTL
ncbi:MAG: thioredoxin [Bacteroidota bacterium]